MSRSSLADLRFAIDCLPQRTREAMLDGVRSNTLIVGAYTDGDGGVCPMLAAHRNGGRTDFALFAQAWDTYTKAPGNRKARRAKPREIRTLVALLEESLGVAAPPATELRGAVADHQALARDRRAREAAGTGGWGWLRRRRAPAPASQAERDDERELVEA